MEANYEKRCAIAVIISVGLIAVCSLSSFAANKVYLYPDYVNTVHSQPISATGSNYYAYCSYTAAGCSIEINVPGAASSYTLAQGQGHTFTRVPSASGNMTVTGTLLHLYNSGSASATVEKK